MHFGEAPINGRTENFRSSASRTKLPEDAAQGGWTRAGHAEMIVDGGMVALWRLGGVNANPPSNTSISVIAVFRPLLTESVSVPLP